MNNKILKIIMFFTISVILFDIPAHGQITKEKELSKAEEFSIQAGTLIQKNFLDVGKVKGVEV